MTYRADIDVRRHFYVDAPQTLTRDVTVNSNVPCRLSCVPPADRSQDAGVGTGPATSSRAANAVRASARQTTDAASIDDDNSSRTRSVVLGGPALRTRREICCLDYICHQHPTERPAGEKVADFPFKCGDFSQRSLSL